ncbi:MBOAT family O-acyltransferase [Flavilitoribacter nigricans]|nr:MBOAT family O-acyltransferase [Flavilitoribacter nigricans]
MLFLPLYFALKGKSRLWWCLAASYFFYGWWDWRFLGLIIFSTLIDFTIGAKMAIETEEDQRKKLLWLSVAINLGVLAFFKYFNFFADSLQEAVSVFGWQLSWNTMHIILPVGISFYTFQSMSYTIDIYRRDLEPEPSFLRFATYISFFPQLVAGPIVRAKTFLPQLRRDHAFNWDNLYLGLAQMLWGFFKKVAIADTLALFVDQSFGSPHHYGSLHLFIGVFFYAVQIYCDFSGYSDIAIGLARTMGYRFPVNFRTPYFSQDFSEFWTRWHITLSSWLRDYLYISLGGNRKGYWKTLRNLMITMLLGGLWHGAGWTFVFWGFLHGLYLILQRMLSPAWQKLHARLRTPKVLYGGLNILIVFSLTCLAWIFFRSTSFDRALIILERMASLEGFSWSNVINKFAVLQGGFLIGILLLVEVSSFQLDYRRRIIYQPVFRAFSFGALLWLIALFGTFGANAFIYFQF